MAKIQVPYRGNELTANLSRQDAESMPGVVLWELSTRTGKYEVTLMKVLTDGKGRYTVSFRQRGFVLPLEEMIKHIEKEAARA